MPMEAGIPIGGEDFSRYVMLEVHYNNPDKIASKINTSWVYMHI